MASQTTSTIRIARPSRWIDILNAKVRAFFSTHVRTSFFAALGAVSVSFLLPTVATFAIIAIDAYILVRILRAAILIRRSPAEYATLLLPIAVLIAMPLVAFAPLLLGGSVFQGTVLAHALLRMVGGVTIIAALAYLYARHALSRSV